MCSRPRSRASARQQSSCRSAACSKSIREVCSLLALLLIICPSSTAQSNAVTTEPASPASAEDARELRSMERFLSLLEKNPRRGTPLDRVYGYHVERGSLDAFIKSWRDRLDKNPADGAAWLILGLLEFQRGQDAAAVTALTKAEATRPQDPLPSFYLGQALVLVGQPENAALAFERALVRKPARTDLLDIFQALGRVYQRTQKNDQALQVWNRLEALFPGDPRVQEQIASALAEENQPAAALPRFEALARKATDPFRQVQLAVSAADLKVRLGRSQDALHDFEAMLAKLRPDSWLHREVRRKIEEVFLRNDDSAGLVAYYQNWTKKEPEDVEALVRLGRTLAGMGRAAEAQTWFDKAVKLAPSRRDLRLALISQLVQDQKFVEAAKEYQALDQAEPNNPDTLRDWGTLVLRDTTKTPPDRKAGAAAVWRKMLEAKPNDPVTIAHVADLLRQAELTDEALELYRKAATLAPTNPQYHEYLGEYLHNLKRTDDARAAWSKIAEPPNHNAKALARLSEVLAGFGYLKEALPPLTEAVGLESDSFDLRLKLASLDHRLEKYDDADNQLAAAAKIAEKDEEKDAVLEARVKNDQAAGRLTQRIDSLRKQLDTPAQATAAAWSVLARYLEIDAKLPEAVRAAERAVEIDPRSIPAWTLLARVREAAGSLGDAAAALRRLSEIDRRNRIEHLTGVARLEARLGRVEPALKAGRDLLAAAPGNPDSSEFFAQLCFGLGRPEEGLDALRRAVRANPNESSVVLRLAETLAGQYQTEEAIEMYWRAFDRTEDLDHKLDVVKKLTELYLQRSQLDRLFARLEHQERDDRPAAASPESRGRDVAICIAQVYASSGDLGSARAELEKLLATDTRDTRLLQQLSKLAEEEGDLETAARYQKMHEELAPGDEGQARLGALLAKAGELEEAQEVWSKAASGKSQSFRVFLAMDNLLYHGRPLPVLEITETMLRANPQDWEALYRQGVALEQLGKPIEAAARFQKLAELTVGDDQKSAHAEALARNPRLQAASPPVALAIARRQPTLPLEGRIGISYMIRYFCKLTPSGPPRGYHWSPADFGQARMSALGWLVSLAGKERPSRMNETIDRVRTAALKTPVDLHAIWSWYYLCLMRYDNAGAFEAGKRLTQVAPGDPLAIWAYLHALGGRKAPLGREFYISQTGQPEENTSPLDRTELDRVVACYRDLRARRPELAQAEIIQNVATELKWAKRVDDEERLYRETVQGAIQIGQLAGALNLAAQRGDVDGLILLSERYDRLQTGRSTPTYATGSFTFTGPAMSLGQGMSVCADRKDYAAVLKLVDFSLTAARRKQEQQSRGAAARASRARVNSLRIAAVNIRYRIWLGSRAVSVPIAFPQVNEYFDGNVIGVLRTAFEIFKKADLQSDLQNHFRRQAGAALVVTDAIYPRLALSSALWWSDERDEAVAELRKVVAASPPESDLRLDLAEVLLQQGSPADALELLDAVQPLDNVSLKRREELAMAAAIAAGDSERARHAAERLFGLRLDTDTQIRISGQMHQLGMHDLAEAVLGRARRRAGGQASSLAALMTQYQRQGKPDQAVQLAIQVLRSSRGGPSASMTSLASLDADAARSAALRALSGSERLGQLITRARDQLAKTPSSIVIHQNLADYYLANRQNDLAIAELGRIAEIKPDDVDLRLRLATQLIQSGQTAAGLGHYKVAFKKDPALAADSFSSILVRAQARPGTAAELIQLLNEIDAESLPLLQYSLVARLIAFAPVDARTDEKVKTLFNRLWKAFPDLRFSLLSQLERDAIWRMPEMIDFAREVIIPRERADSPFQYYYPFMWPNLIASGPPSVPAAQTQPAVLRFLDLAESQGSLDRLADEIDLTRKRIPDWKVAEALQAMVLSRAGRFDEARPLVPRAIESLQKDETQSIDNYKVLIYWALALELERHAPTRDLAFAAYLACAGDPYGYLQFRTLRATTLLPVRQIVPLAIKLGRQAEARGALSRQARIAWVTELQATEVGTIYRTLGLDAIGTSLAEMGFAADAVPLFQEARKLSEGIDTSVSSLFPDLTDLPRRIADHLNSAINGMSASDLAPVAGRAIAESAREPAKATPGGAPDDSRKDRGAQVLDLMTVVHPREVDRAAVRSLFAESLAACDARELAQLGNSLEALQKAYPEDLSVAIGVALHALASNDEDRSRVALERVEKLLGNAPLDPLADGTRANARERAEAARQIPLWLIARACGANASPSLRTISNRLGARALEGARRQADRLWTLALMREQGQTAFDKNDRASASAVWSRMLDLVVAPPQAKGRRPSAKP
jgi:tetratricopeptide (TPR) repeat protein